MQDIDHFKNMLLAAREAILGLADARTASAATVVLDQTSVGRLSRMDAMQGQAMALATERRRHEENRRVEAAIRRIDEGEYGFCISCGEPIPAKRLAVDPIIPTCIRCASGAGG